MCLEIGKRKLGKASVSMHTFSQGVGNLQHFTCVESDRAFFSLHSTGECCCM